MGTESKPRFNFFDIRKECVNPPDCYPEDGLNEYVNSPEFYQLIKGTGIWEEGDDLTYNFLALDE